MDTSLVANLRKKLEVKVEAPKPVAATATPTADVVAKTAFNRDAREAFTTLAEAGEKLRKFLAIPEHKREDEVRTQVADLTAGIAAVKTDIRADGAAYERYIGEIVPRGPEAMEVLVDFVARGILGEISAADAEKMEEGWAEWRAKRDAGASEQEIEDLRRERGLQKVFVMPERRDYRSPVGYRYFTKKYPAPDGTDGLMKALASRFRYWEEGDRRTERLATRLAGTFGVESEKTLANLVRGEVCRIAVVMSDDAWWVDQRSGGLMSPSVIGFEGIGIGDDGVAKMQISWAAGPIFPSLRRHTAHEEKDGQKVPATEFGFVPGRGFEGLCRREVAPNGAKSWSDRQERWLYSLLRAIGGFPLTSPARDLRQFKPQTRRGQTNLPEGETRKGGGGGKNSSRRHKADRGGARDWRHEKDGDDGE